MFGWFRHMFALKDLVDKDLLSLSVNFEPAQVRFIPDFEVVDTGAELQESRSISGTFCRWHERALAPPLVPIWQSFVDDDRKWAAQSRFAGPAHNCGHFFSLSEQVATSEATHYGVDFASSEFLEIKACFAKVLDLSTEKGRRQAFNAVVENPDFSEAFIAEELVEEVTGGTILTDRIGHWASRGGYEAILYVGPRVIWDPTLEAVDERRPPSPWNPNLFPMYEQSIRESTLNLVVFRGRYLLSRIIEFRVEQGPWITNDLYGLTEDEIEARLSDIPEYAAFGEEYQQEKRRSVFIDKLVYCEK